MGYTTKTKKAGYIGDKFIAKGTALTSSQFFNWRSGPASSSQGTPRKSAASSAPEAEQSSDRGKVQRGLYVPDPA